MCTSPRIARPHVESYWESWDRPGNFGADLSAIPVSPIGLNSYNIIGYIGIACNTELHPQGGIFFLAPAGGSDLRGLNPKGY